MLLVTTPNGDILYGDKAITSSYFPSAGILGGVPEVLTLTNVCVAQWFIPLNSPGSLQPQIVPVDRILEVRPHPSGTGTLAVIFSEGGTGRKIRPFHFLETIPDIVTLLECAGGAPDTIFEYSFFAQMGADTTQTDFTFESDLFIGDPLAPIQVTWSPALPGQFISILPNTGIEILDCFLQPVLNDALDFEYQFDWNLIGSPGPAPNGFAIFRQFREGSIIWVDVNQDAVGNYTIVGTNLPDWTWIVLGPLFAADSFAVSTVPLPGVTPLTEVDFYQAAWAQMESVPNFPTPQYVNVSAGTAGYSQIVTSVQLRNNAGIPGTYRIFREVGKNLLQFWPLQPAGTQQDRVLQVKVRYRVL